MGGATRFMTLLTTPFPPLRPSIILLRRRLSSLSTTPLRPLSISSPSNTKSHTPQLAISFHSQPNNNTYPPHPSAAAQPHHHHHSWPEWTHFLNILSNGQGFSASEDQGIPPEDAFVVYEELSDDFVRAAAACLDFARARPNLIGLLSRRDIEAVVSNGTPFLFKSALDTARRMRTFLGTDGSNLSRTKNFSSNVVNFYMVNYPIAAQNYSLYAFPKASEFDKANTIDLMKYILSYASNPTVSSERNGLYSRELVDSSIRNLLNELRTVSCGVPSNYIPASDRQLPGGQRQTPKPFGQNIEMKRGDWICTKCNFMNFARNMKCLECEESRPKKLLTGGEWECPQCNFCNYGRNSVCLRCDCRRPGSPLFNTINSTSRSTSNADYSHKPDMDNSFAENEEKAKSWFNKISQLNNATNINSPASVEEFPEIKPKNSTDQVNNQDLEKNQAEKSEKWFKKMAELHDVKDLPSAVSDEDFPEIMPMRKGENRFVVSKKKDRSLTSLKYKRQVAMDQANNTTFVPFVPFPPGYFDKKDPDQSNGLDLPVKSVSDSKIASKTEKVDDSKYRTADASTFSRKDGEEMISPKNPTFSREIVDDRSNFSRIDKKENLGSSWSGKSLEGSAVTETDPLDMSEEAKAERWFKRVAQIKDISELSQIPDEDFPSIMPMRKGVNRFVVSKRKTPLERRLTSQQYRRNLPIVSNEPVKKESDNS
ncbi:hypothetical protein BUALT_Bualt16G0104100 [Buddleja alternifolia]|uniref:RanBP2-type domain-containing protein n=1 Tax=Buddleja alternifolia TaxID=168488 RepID=A0AAV6WAL3_9LAMI|nr:hypothetical protein BUALT_Bualt16G0104100 [Buddleja alternifolia]